MIKENLVLKFSSCFKMKIILISLIVLTVLFCNAQQIEDKLNLGFEADNDTEFDEGSNFKLNTVTPQQIENLYELCKIWGFVKYHHPQVAKGNFNWDYELFRILPAINSADFQEQVYLWITSLGPLNEPVITRALAGKVKLSSPAYWIYNEKMLSEDLSRELQNIQNSRKEDENYYLDFKKGVGNPVFKHEKPYPEMNWDDTGFKLLGLFRFWNQVEYFFPNRHLMDENWDEVLKEFIARLVANEDGMAGKLTMLELIGKIQDTHADLVHKDFNQYFGNNSAPLQLAIIEDKIVVTKVHNEVADQTKIKVGDVILKIEGKDISVLIEEQMKYSPASNQVAQIARTLKRRLLRTNKDHMNLKVYNGTSIFEEKIKTLSYSKVFFMEDEIPSHSVIKNDIGYIYPHSLQKGEIDSIMVDFMDKEGLIVDLRSYPSEFIVYSLGKYLMPKPTDFYKASQTSLDNPGEFVLRDGGKVGEINLEYFKGKVIILINQNSLSLPEFMTMAFRTAPRATVIGSQTAGADGNISCIYLPGGLYTVFSGIGIYYPDGAETQRIGIIPDIEVKPTIEGIKNGRDELMEKAIELILSE